MAAILFKLFLIGILGCSGLSDEETTDRIRFTEFFFFPTAPYVDKSYIEVIPKEELATLDIDYEAEVAAIQDVYKAFINAYVAKDMDELSKTFDRSTGMEYGTSTAKVYGWFDIKGYIEGNWFGPWGGECSSEEDWKLTDFYIRPKNVGADYAEASAKGPMFYYKPDGPVCYSEIGRFYFTKRTGDWRIHQIDGSRYFSDPKYKVP